MTQNIATVPMGYGGTRNAHAGPGNSTCRVIHRASAMTTKTNGGSGIHEAQCRAHEGKAVREGERRDGRNDPACAVYQNQERQNEQRMIRAWVSAMAGFVCMVSDAPDVWWRARAL